MTARKTQREWIREQLDLYGEISRNQCLLQFIARLAPRIQELEEEGYVFETEHRGGDYVYRVVKLPAAKQLTLV